MRVHIIEDEYELRNALYQDIKLVDQVSLAELVVVVTSKSREGLVRDSLKRKRHVLTRYVNNFHEMKKLAKENRVFLHCVPLGITYDECVRAWTMETLPFMFQNIRITLPPHKDSMFEMISVLYTLDPTGKCM